MNRRTRITVALACLLCWVAPLSFSEDTPPVERVGGLTFKSTIELTVVNITVNVTDRSGSPVRDLTQDDFRVYQDGELREITHFESHSRDVFMTEPVSAVPRKTPEGDVGPEDSPTPRPTYVVLYIDNENLDPLDRNRVLSVAYDFVHDTLRPPVTMMVASYDRRLKIAQPFTDDPQLVERALRAQRRKTGGRPEMEQTVQRLLDEISRYRQGGSGGGMQSPTLLLDQIHGIADEQTNSLAFTLQALRSIVSMMAGLPGKKSIIYVSNGLPMISGMELLTAYTEATQDPGAMSGISRHDQTRHFRALASAAAAQGVSFYTIAAGGLEVLAGTGADVQTVQDTGSMRAGHENRMDSMRFLAEQTGGQAVVNTNNFERGFTRIADDHFTYYSLGYQLSMSGADKVHRIRVEIPEHPEYTVRHRKRYVEKSLETQVQDAVMTNLVFPVDENPLEIQVETGDPTPASEDRWVMPIAVSFPLRNVALIPRGEAYAGHCVLFIAAKDAEGGQSELVRQPHEVEVSQEQYDALKDERWVINSNLLMTSGALTVSVGMMDAVTRQASYGRVTTFIRGD